MILAEYQRQMRLARIQVFQAGLNISQPYPGSVGGLTIRTVADTESKHSVTVRRRHLYPASLARWCNAMSN